MMACDEGVMGAGSSRHGVRPAALAARSHRGIWRLMPRARWAALAILPCAAAFGAVQAQDLPDGKIALDGGVLELTLEDAVRLALERNPEFLATLENREVQKLELEIAEDRWAPKVTLNPTLTKSQDTGSREGDVGTTIELPSTHSRLDLGWTENRRDRDVDFRRRGVETVIDIPATGSKFTWEWSEDSSDSSADTRSVSLRFNQPLLKGGPAIADHTIRSARIGEQGNILGLRGAAASQISETIGKYRGLISAVRQVEIAEAALRRAQEQLARTRALIEVGRVARREAVRSEAAIANRELALVTARNALVIANLELVDHLAFEETVRIRPLASLTVERREVDRASVLADALRLRTDFRQAQLGVETARIALEKARNDLLPDLNLGFSRSRTYYRQGGSPASTSWDVTLNAGIPLIDRQLDVGLVKARLGLRQAQRTLTKTRTSIDIAVRRAVTNVRVNLRRIDLAREARELAESNLEIEKGKFNEGLASNAEVATAEDNLVEAERAEVDAIDAHLTALRTLDEVSGRTLERWNVQLETAVR